MRLEATPHRDHANNLYRFCLSLAQAQKKGIKKTSHVMARF
jgi:hypothetical protein